jgi:hypothetical protein
MPEPGRERNNDQPLAARHSPSSQGGACSRRGWGCHRRACGGGVPRHATVAAKRGEGPPLRPRDISRSPQESCRVGESGPCSRPFRQNLAEREKDGAGPPTTGNSPTPIQVFDRADLDLFRLSCCNFGPPKGISAHGRERVVQCRLL